jgi:peptide/nickel transport system substrate-binding protein
LYFNGSGITSQIEIHFYDEQLDNDDFDVILSDSFEEFSQKKETNKKEVVFPSMQWEHLDFKMPNTILFEKKVRKALCDAISLEELNFNVWNGDAYPTDRWFLHAHPSNKNAKADFIDSVVSLEELMEDNDINLIILTSDIYRKKCANYIKEKWESIGIKVNIKELEDEEFFELLRQKSPKEARVFLYSWIFGEKTDLFSILHSTSIPGAKNDYFGENYACYQNGDVDILLLQTLKEVNSQKRAQLLSNIQEIVKNDYYTIPLYNIPQKAFIKKDIEGISVPFSGTKLDWNVENWYRYHGGK